MRSEFFEGMPQGAGGNMSRAQQNYTWDGRESRSTGFEHQFVAERTGTLAVCTDLFHDDWSAGSTGIELILSSSCGRINERRRLDDAPPAEGQWVDVIFDHLPTQLSYRLEVVMKDGTRQVIFSDVKYGEINGLCDDLREGQSYPMVPESDESE